MNQNHSNVPAPGMTFSDVLYIIFRHKWLIGILSLLAIIASGAVYLLWPVPYKSEARLLIKYVVDAKNPSQMGPGGSKVTAVDDRGEAILNTELELLGSFDLALEVANVVGPSNILAKVGGGNNPMNAAGLIRKNLTLESPKKSSVIHVIFEHNDIGIVKPVLDALIKGYYTKHQEIHRDVGQLGDSLKAQTEYLHNRLLSTEEELRTAKTNAGIISLEDTKKVYGGQMARIRSAILEAEVELAERQAAATEMAKLMHIKAPETNNEVSATNDVAVAPEKLSEYKQLCALLDRLSKRQEDLLVQFTPENSWVKHLDEQISSTEKRKRQLEDENLGLVAVGVSSGARSGDTGRGIMVNEMARVSGLQSRIKILSQQLADIQKAAAMIYATEGPISDLQRKFALEETQYNYFSMSLEQSKIDAALSDGRVFNISQIQAATPPSQDPSKKQKVSGAILVGGIVLAIALAFLIEFYLDRSIKRPVEIENQMGLPLFISIPRVSLAKQRRSLKNGADAKRLQLSRSGQVEDDVAGSGQRSHERGELTKAQKDEGITASSPSNDLHPAPWHAKFVLRPFCDALRDSLITFFEVNNLTHKPKLVAVTSCSPGAGVSTIAAGLAASLSETGEGNVLLVNMNQTDGAMHQFYRGRLKCDLDDALEIEKRKDALVQDNLYVANETPNGDSLPVILPKRFKSLVPRLRASDYDYIIFDMPAVGQITPTQRLARFMDMVLMVVESEKTDRDMAKRVGAMLTDTKTHVRVVLNKTRSHVPRLLVQEA